MKYLVISLIAACALMSNSVFAQSDTSQLSAQQIAQEQQSEKQEQESKKPMRTRIA